MSIKRTLGLLTALVLLIAGAPSAGARADDTQSPPPEILVGTTQFRSVSTPAVSGTRKVGRTLTAKSAAKPSATAWTYQWYRNGQPIGGATARSHTLTGADYGKRITVKTTAWATGYRQRESKASKRGSKVGRGTLATAVPTIGGAAEIGSTLTASTGGWTAGVRFSYKWLRDGKTIPKATGASYVPVQGDKGKRLAVKVTGELTGYSKASRSSTKTAAVALATIPEADRLRVGSFNIRVSSATEDSNNPLERPWRERLPRVAEQISTEKLDVVGVQEASAGRTFSGQPQFQDLADALGSGWALTNDVRYCDTDRAEAHCPNGAGQNDRILYRTDRLELLRQGSRKLDDRTSYANGKARFAVWAEFSDRNTGKQFFFVNTHLEPGGSGKVHDRQAKVILDEIESQNTRRLPVIVVGDLAATKFSNPNGAHDAFVKASYIDSLGNAHKQKTAAGIHAEKVINGDVNSANYFKAKPQRVGGAYELGSYLDYILVSSRRIRVLEWKTVVGRLDAHGNFADVIPSDHHLVRAIIALP